ncbi:hypothetical protein BURMUCF2_A1888 [Burkholderia multivorans CF2]|nr:hypothetical protein BURMUCF2_A1888 [Burkholderia multivorans CF2]
MSETDQRTAHTQSYYELLDFHIVISLEKMGFRNPGISPGMWN